MYISENIVGRVKETWLGEVEWFCKERNQSRLCQKQSGNLWGEVLTDLANLMAAATDRWFLRAVMEMAQLWCHAKQGLALGSDHYWGSGGFTSSLGHWAVYDCFSHQTATRLLWWCWEVCTLFLLCCDHSSKVSPFLCTRNTCFGAWISQLI